MAVHTLTVSTITQGHDDAARGVIRDYSAYLRGMGGEVAVYRTLYSADNVGRVLVYLAAPDAEILGSILDKILADGANNPYSKAVIGPNPPLNLVSRITVRSVEPDAPILPAAALRAVRVYSAPSGRRVEAEQALREARMRHAELGVQAGGFLIDYGGPNSGFYAYTVAHDSMSSLADFTRRNAQVPAAPPILAAVDRGAMTQVSARIDRLMDLG